MSLLERLQQEKEAQGEKPGGHLQVVRKDPHQELKRRLHRRLIDEMDPDLLQMGEGGKEGLEEKVRQLCDQFLEEEEGILSRAEHRRIVEEMVDEITGLGPIDPLLQDPEVTEIMVNHPQQVYVERKGILEKTTITFQDNAHIMRIIERIVTPLGRRIDESMPMVDARLPDGSRVNAVIPPLALRGPCLTIRKFSRDPYQVEDLIRFGTLTPQMARFLEACVRGRLNIIVSGGTGSGKTTTLNVLSSFIPAGERIVTIEDAAELQLHQEHVVTLETRPPNIEGKGEISMRDLVRNALRMRPDRIVVGEVRSGEALDMLQAMNTGHDGSLTTAHANSPRDLLARLETMVLMAGMDLPLRAIREQVASAVDLIVQQSRLPGGSRKITHITEVLGLEGDVITLQDLFLFRQQGVDYRRGVQGEFTSTGIRPRFLEKLKAAGIELASEIFWHSQGGGN
ncbi:MAG: CpaF family protein [bacterium]|jgi:pilus assembly protein CpaF